MQLKVKKGRSGSERIGDAGVVGPDRLWGAPVAFCCSVAIGPPTTGSCGDSRCRDRVLWVVREEGVRCATGRPRQSAVTGLGDAYRDISRWVSALSYLAVLCLFAYVFGSCGVCHCKSRSLGASVTETKALRQGGGKSLILNAALNRCCSELFPLAVLKALPTSFPARNGKQSLSSASRRY